MDVKLKINYEILGKHLKKMRIFDMIIQKEFLHKRKGLNNG